MRNLPVPIRRVVWGASLALMLLLAACGGGGEEPPLVEEAPPVEEPAPVESGPLGSGLCAHEYFPVVDGASWTYSGTSMEGPFGWTTSTTDVSDTGFTLINIYDVDGEAVHVTQAWSCSAAGIAALEFGGGPEGTLTATGIEATFETLESSGVTFPTVISVGDSWTQTYTVEGVMTMTDMQSTVSGVVTHNYSAVAIETVDTPAGSFEALKLVVDTHFDFQVNLLDMGFSMPFAIDSQAITWLARNVGWVRNDSSASFEGSEGLSTSVDLQSYTIP
ncbi:MAG: hypothetical protein KIS85_09170 [Anaerolineales bacterium]|nr:hypothetical protein [Anaerolineales bacterium]